MASTIPLSTPSYLPQQPNTSKFLLDSNPVHQPSSPEEIEEWIKSPLPIISNGKGMPGGVRKLKAPHPATIDICAQNHMHPEIPHHTTATFTSTPTTTTTKSTIESDKSHPRQQHHHKSSIILETSCFGSNPEHAAGTVATEEESNGGEDTIYSSKNAGSAKDQKCIRRTWQAVTLAWILSCLIGVGVSILRPETELG
jgi:hypothetical protein